jgi:hypothetical protein
MSDNKDFVWDDLLVAEFAGRASWINEAKDIPSLLEKFKEEKSKPKRHWVVFTMDGFGYQSWMPVDWRGNKRDGVVGIKCFDTKESAEEFILLNKPLLSVNDIVSISEYTYDFMKLHRKRLAELAKEKLSK